MSRAAVVRILARAEDVRRRYAARRLSRRGPQHPQDRASARHREATRAVVRFANALVLRAGPPEKRMALTSDELSRQQRRARARGEKKAQRRQTPLPATSPPIAPIPPPPPAPSLM